MNAAQIAEAATKLAARGGDTFTEAQVVAELRKLLKGSTSLVVQAMIDEALHDFGITDTPIAPPERDETEGMAS